MFYVLLLYFNSQATVRTFTGLRRLLGVHSALVGPRLIRFSLVRWSCSLPDEHCIDLPWFRQGLTIDWNRLEGTVLLTSVSVEREVEIMVK